MERNEILWFDEDEDDVVDDELEDDIEDDELEDDELEDDEDDDDEDDDEEEDEEDEEEEELDDEDEDWDDEDGDDEDFDEEERRGRVSSSVPVPLLPRPSWIRAKAPQGPGLRAPPGPDAGTRAAHGLRGGALSEPRRVLEPRHRHVHDPRRRLHPGVRVLRGEDGPAGAAAGP